MNNKVLLEENKKYKFDFSHLEYVWEMLCSSITRCKDYYLKLVNKRQLLMEHIHELVPIIYILLANKSCSLCFQLL